MERARRGDPPAGRLLCVLPAKGGSGASTVALHLADALARRLGPPGAGRPARVLFAELDFHSAATAFRLGFDPAATIEDALNSVERPAEDWRRLATRWGGFDILPAPPLGARLSQQALDNITALFESALAGWQIVIADLPPALYAACRDVLRLAETVFLVGTGELESRRLVARRLRDLAALGFPAHGLKLIVNRAEAGAAEPLVEGIEEVCRLPNDYAAVNDAQLKAKLLPAENEISKRIDDLARRIASEEL